MAEPALRGPAVLAPAARSWMRISPRLVPVFAFITALLIGIPFMIVTSGRGDIGRGLNIAGVAYSALLEGAVGITINDLLSPDDVSLVRTLSDLSRRQVDDLAEITATLPAVGLDNVRRYGELLAEFESLDDEQLDTLGSSIPEIEVVGLETLTATRPLIADLGRLERADVRPLAEEYAAMDELAAEDRARLEEVAPSAAGYSDEDLLRYMVIVNTEGIVKLERLVAQADILAEQDIALDSQAASDLTAIAAQTTATTREQVEALARVEQAGISDLAALSEQLTIVDSLYDADLLAEEDVAAALETELDTAIAGNLIVRRPGTGQNALLVDVGKSQPAGIVYNDNGTPGAVYLRLGSSAFLFFPGELEEMLVRSIPFVIAGLAVALALKTGLFSIGATGQLYIAGTLTAWVGFSPIFAGLPSFLHIPLAIIAGVIGGALWGAIPGALKAYTGAHEVINTIMLNFVAIRLVDWLIKSTDPVILLDETASLPRTPFINTSAQLPSFDQISPILFILAGVIVAAWDWRRRHISRNPRQAVRPLVSGVITAALGFFLGWISVRSNLHIGLIIMVLIVLLTDWFLTRTTVGFELRTVGANADAARYAGMNVKWNIILAMTLSGALAGLAGAVEIAGVKYAMQPEFFANLGFDAIAVALLARIEPRSMIWAGLLWGGLLSGANLMQVRANISIDLVLIIQALIIMFIAADQIIRYMWRVPEATLEEKQAATLARGWSG